MTRQGEGGLLQEQLKGCCRKRNFDTCHQRLCRHSLGHMGNSKKPIVFLSHSSHDKSQLVALKNLLDERSAGALDFFLSSDGESIRLGRNWVTRISDALSEAQLMFVFLSPRSAESKWIHFEAGHAYSNDLDVVPVCLPGMDFSLVTPPLSLLQGFNLHSHEALQNLARVCNKKFDMKIKESFSAADFKQVFDALAHKGGGFFGHRSFAVERVEFYVQLRFPETEKITLLSNLTEIAKFEGVDYSAYDLAEHGQVPRTQVDLPGCCISMSQDIRNYSGEPPIKEAHISGSLSPDLFHLNAPLLDKWFKHCPVFIPWRVSISLQRQFRIETQRHQLTTKLYKSDIKLIDGANFTCDGLTFQLNPNSTRAISFECKGKLNEERLPKLIERLFDLNIIFEAPISPEDDYSLSRYFANSYLR